MVRSGAVDAVDYRARLWPLAFLLAASLTFALGCKTRQAQYRSSAYQAAPSRSEEISGGGNPSILSQVTQYDPVSGAAVINTFTLGQEVEMAKQIEADLIARERAAGHIVNGDATAYARIESILKAVAGVSHLPRMPWRLLYSSRNEFNAFASPGGVVLVLKGLADSVDDDELGAVLGHEVAHATCRHTTERLTHEKVASLASETARTALYKASYSTENEEEADKVGLLYAALAGYDPKAAHRIWSRMHERFGSNPGNYTYTHPLNQERAERTQRLGTVAAQYYAGPRTINPRYGEILASNDLAPRLGNTGNESVDFLSAALLEHLKYRQAKAEANQREEADAAARERKAAALKFMRINRVFVGKTGAGKPGVFADVQNGSNTLMRKVAIQFFYKTVQGTWAPYQGKVVLGDLKSGETRNWGVELDAAAHSRWQFSASVTDLDF